MSTAQANPLSAKYQAWIKQEMAGIVGCGVFEHSEDVACAGGAVLVEGYKER